MDNQFEAFRKMLLIRLTEDAIAEDFRKNKIFSFYHSSAGQEAVAVGVCMGTQQEDRVYGNHRSHGHYLAKGGNLYRMLAEIYGKSSGCCKGYGGSMHMLDRSVNFMGSTPLLGSALPIAVGSAWEQKIHESAQVTVVFTGDGASEEGVFYESLNLAAVKRLPVIFVVEDNLYAVNTPSNDRRGDHYSLEKVVQGLGAAYYKCDGNSFKHTYAAAVVARSVVKGAEIPVVMHAITFRHMAHSGPITDESVRKADTIAIRTETDPIRRMASDLSWAEYRLETIRKEVESDIKKAMAKVKAHE